MKREELKEFVSKTLTDIIEGVSDAQELAEDNGAIVNPAMLNAGNKPAGDSYTVDTSSSRKNIYSAQMVDFDVEFTKSNVASENVRIKFSVPVVFPYQK
jgi:hypothetical protein